jgi:hypothetical protein
MASPASRPQLRCDPEANAFYVSVAAAPLDAKWRIDVDADGIIMEFADDVLVKIEVLTVAERRLPPDKFAATVAPLVGRLYASGAIDRREPAVIDA